MLVLRSSPASPFGRKVRIAAAILGLSERIEVVAADTNDPEEPLRRQNPLGKIPALIAEDGEAIFDSRVILEYLDWLAGADALIPRDPAARFQALTLQALADGVMDAAILQIYEQRFREPALRSTKWLDHQADKVTRALAALEKRPPESSARHVGAIALACALGYLDLRFEGLWRSAHPRLAAWLEAFAAGVPAFEATRFRA
ncbi:MAG: glutathione S-transferase N-terminal domain-containing protein [Roseiarcus sp.]